MPILAYSNAISERLRSEPDLEYLDAFMRNPRLGNDVCNDRERLAREVVVLERRDKEWHGRVWNVGKQPWEMNDGADGYAVVMNYIDPEAIESLTEGLGIDVMSSAEYSARRGADALETSNAMIKRAETSIRRLPADQIFNETIVHALSGLIGEITALWNVVTFYADMQVSALEDQLEHDFWDKPRNPVTILHEAQRLSRNLTRYRGQVVSMEEDLAFSSAHDVPVAMTTDLDDIKSRLRTLIKRTDKAVPALLASIAINEGTKASSLTAVALWFAPLSLSVSIVSIDGDSKFGGRKFWIWACIGFPFLVMVILLANSSDRLINWLGKRRRGRALLAMFKPETHIQ
ncbi:MAG: hypothetical protein Q9163_004135 [Psora crenata]